MKMLHRMMGGSIGVAAAFMLNASNTQAQNLLINGDFESASGFTANPISTTSGTGGTSGVNQGWATFGAGQSDMSSAASSPESGTYSLLAVNGPGNDWNPQGAYQIIDGIVAGQTYTLTAYYLIDSLSANTGTYTTPFDMSIHFGNLVGSTWTDVTTDETGWSGVPSLDTWVQASITITAPVGASEAAVYLFYMDDAQTTVDQMYMDNASLVAVPEPTTMALVSMGLAVPFYLLRRRKV
ncbi:MAG TPA: carbohydrate binding domain-containing protein [Verrucomicrobiae bacterium]|nr:carbohydrate binding domain-containing protein [Verrucomicrobiae bacterium]